MKTPLLAETKFVRLAKGHDFDSSASRIAAASSVSVGEIATDGDTGNSYLRTSTGWIAVETAGVAHVAPPDMLSGSVVWNEIANLTTTRQKLDFPSGATAIKFLYSQNSTSGTTAAVGRATYIVFNATSDADADGKLALAGARYRLPLGAFPYGALAAAASPITRVDVISEAAETGHSTLMVEARVPS